MPNEKTARRAFGPIGRLRPAQVEPATAVVVNRTGRFWFMPVRGPVTLPVVRVDAWARS